MGFLPTAPVVPSSSTARLSRTLYRPVLYARRVRNAATMPAATPQTAAAVTATPSARNPTPPFEVDAAGYMTVVGVRVNEVVANLGTSPACIYSKAQIEGNLCAYQAALEGLGHIIGYAFKAKNNLRIIELLRSLGSEAVLVSGNELRLAVKAGINMKKTVFYGNEKTLAELKFAVLCGCLINIDLEFDLEHITQAAKKIGKIANLIIRINPNVNP